MLKKNDPQINNRRDLFDYYEEHMNKTYRQILNSGHLEGDTNVLKTYLLEFAWDPLNLNISEPAYLSENLSLKTQGTTGNTIIPKVIETEEEGLYLLTWPGFRSEPKLYLETGINPDRRFWTAYSLSDAADIDRALDNLTNHQPDFDRFWLWPDYLSKKQSEDRCEFRGVGLDYDHRRFIDRISLVEPTDYFKVQIWGGKESQRILQFIASNDDFKRRMVISKIRMKCLHPTDLASFAIEDLKYNGKFTTRGSSFNTHQSLVYDIKNEYSKCILDIEKRFSSPFWSNNIDEYTNPIFFSFGDYQVTNLDLFCKVVFSGKQPFRLWGVPERTQAGDDGREVAAVDLHTGSRLYFEIYRDIITMTLHEGSCGNTVARFFTHLQQTFSHEIIAEDNDGRRLFQ
jgi:hypothetical protein